MLRREDQVLLCHRGPDRSHYPDVWDLPGATSNREEQLVDALKRELKEELGIVAHLPDGAPWMTPEDGTIQLHIYLSDMWRGEPNDLAPDEHDEIRWTTPGQAAELDLAHPFYRQMINRALA